MNFLVSFFSEVWVQRLGWVLIHFLWEGTIIALVLAVFLRLLTKASSQTRYALAGIAFLICAIAPAITWTMLAPHEGGSSPMTELGPVNHPQSQASMASPSIALLTSLQAPVESKKPWQIRLVYAANASLPYAVGLWFVGVIILSSRLTLGWIWMKRLCRSSIPAKDPRCLEKFESLLTRMQIARPVRLLESALIEVPTLIGWLRPTILIPVSLFAGMTPDQLEAIFAHELAHVRRCDYLVNLFQTVIETILFYHPAVWWISRKLREERENCCDDIALEVMSDRLVYASALAQLEEGRATSLALMATGGSLLQRIKRIAGQRASGHPMGLPAILALISLFAALAVVSLLEAQNNSSPAALATPKSILDTLQLGDLKVQNSSYEEILAKITEQTKQLDPAKTGVTFDRLTILRPGKSSGMTVSGEFGHQTVREFLDHESEGGCFQYEASTEPVKVWWISEAQAGIRLKMSMVPMNLDFQQTDVRTALKTLQAEASKNGLNLSLNLDGIKGAATSPVTLKCGPISLDQAFHAVCYLGGLRVVSWNREDVGGYDLFPNQDGNSAPLQFVKVEMQTFTFPHKNNDPQQETRVQALLPNPAPESMIAEKLSSIGKASTLVLVSPKRSDFYPRWGFVEMPEIEATKAKVSLRFYTSIKPDANIDFSGNFGIENGAGVTDSGVSGFWLKPSGTNVVLLYKGKRAFNEPLTPLINDNQSEYLAVIRASLVDQDGKEIGMVSQNTEMTEWPSDFAVSTPPSSNAASAPTVDMSGTVAEKDKLAAVVNGRQIMMSEVDQQLTDRLKVLQQTYSGEALKEHIAAARLNVLKSMVDRQLIIDDFRSQGHVIPTSYTDERINDIVKDEYGGDRNAFIRTLGERKVPLARYRTEIEDNAIVGWARNENVAKKVTDYYQKHLDLFPQDEQIDVTTVQIRTLDTASKKFPDDSDAQILNAMRTGADLTDLIKKYGVDPDMDGKPLWYTKAGPPSWPSYLPVSWDSIEKMRPGEAIKGIADAVYDDGKGRSQPCKICYLVRVNDRHDAKISDTSLTSMQKNALIKAEADRLQMAWLSDLRSKAKVQIFMVVDAEDGATSGSEPAVQTAVYQPASAKDAALTPVSSPSN